MAGKSQEPYLSFVIAGRNDNYGGDFNYRLRNSIHTLSHYLERFKVPSEYIIVNYNPKDDEEPLSSAIEWPEGREYLKIRIITVPQEVHKTLEDPEIRKTVPLYEYIAKNVGVRRAKAPFICAANPDILYPKEVVEFLAEQKLEKGAYYRTDRTDFHGFEDAHTMFPSMLVNKARRRSFRVFLKGYTYLQDMNDFFDYRYNKLKSENEARLAKECVVRDMPPEFHFHCNCSGDFMLMHRDHWDALDGHPEDTLVSAHTDAMFVIMSAMLGLKEVVLDWPVYHQNHERRYDCEGERVDPAVEKMYKTYERLGRKMLREKKPIVNNNPDWGLNQYTFDELEF